MSVSTCRINSTGMYNAPFPYIYRCLGHKYIGSTVAVPLPLRVALVVAGRPPETRQNRSAPAIGTCYLLFMTNPPDLLAKA